MQSRVELSIGNKHVFCIRRVYFSADSSPSLLINLKENQKKTKPVILKGTVVSATTLHKARVYYTTGSHVR